MKSKRKPFTQIAENFKFLLRPGDADRLQTLVNNMDANWYDVVAIAFTKGLDAWERDTAAALAEDNAAQAQRRNTEARNICVALWGVWHKQREIYERKAKLGCADLHTEREKELCAWDAYIMVRRMIRAQEAADAIQNNA